MLDVPAPAVAVLAGAVLLAGVVSALDAPPQPGSAPAVETASSAPAMSAPVPTPVASAAPTSNSRPPAPEAQQLLDGLAVAVARARTVRFTAVTERVPEGGTAEVEGRLTGVLDVPADAGRADVDLPALAALAEEADGDAALTALSTASLRWTGRDVSITAGDQTGTVPRRSGRGGLLERLPEEPVEVLRLASQVTPINADAPVDVDGVPTTLVEGEADATAVAAVLGTAPDLIASLGAVPVDVWVAADGLPLRVRVTAALPARGGLPPRSLVTTYDFRGWGAPVDLGA